MRFHVDYDTNQLKQEMEEFLEGIMKFFMESKSMTFLSAKKTGELIIPLLVMDDLMDVYAKNCGESGEMLLRDYWATKALAYGMAGKATVGRVYLTKARQRRTGGKVLEWCQTYYHTS